MRFAELTMLWRATQDTGEWGIPHGSQLRIVGLSLLQHPQSFAVVLLDRMETLQVHLDILKLFSCNEEVRIHARTNGA